MSSKNSSKPPSSEGPAESTSLRKPSGRGPGKWQVRHSTGRV
ncbi:hypothetical protein ACWGQ5_32315 [Streptomyces sp. NPDC055722]